MSEPVVYLEQHKSDGRWSVCQARTHHTYTDPSTGVVLIDQAGASSEPLRVPRSDCFFGPDADERAAGECRARNRAKKSG